MSDRYLDFTHSPLGKQLAGMLGLPSPPRLQRATGGYELQPLARRVVLVGGGSKGLYSGAVVEALHAAGSELYVAPSHAGLAPIKAAASDLKVTLKGEPTGETFAPYALVFDASGIDSADALRELYEFMQPRVGRVARNGRIVLIGQAPDAAESVGAATAATALRGFTHSLGKEAGGKGVTVNLIEVGKGAEGWLAGPLRFFLTEHSAFVSGQSLVLGNVPRGQASGPFVNSLAGKTALVTGAARGIGASIAQTLAREGAQVIGMDRPQEEGALAETMSRIGGRGLALDVTAKDAPQRIATELGGLDIVVHNAGVTRDKMLRNMPPHWWDQVLNINLGAIMRINERLLEGGLNDGARMVCISSIGGIGGNAGQTNYGATKAGIIGYAEALAPVLARRGGAINAVAPGFIETAMTAAMPAMPREVGRRLASLSQGGLPIDIAEAVTFFASPLAGGVNGRTLRVCGQNFMGA